MFEDYIYTVYPYIKIIHIVAVISWMAGLLYLPRLFVYHTQIVKNKEANILFKTMERRLLKIIMLPASIITWLTGLLLAYIIGFKTNSWLHVKILFVIFLTISHHIMSRYCGNFAQDSNHKSEKFYRVLNEVPTILMVIIVTVVVMK